MPALRKLHLREASDPPLAELPATLSDLTLYHCTLDLLDLPEAMELDSLTLRSLNTLQLSGSLASCKALTIYALGQQQLGPFTRSERLSTLMLDGATTHVSDAAAALIAAPLTELDMRCAAAQDSMLDLLPQLHHIERLTMTRLRQLTDLRRLSAQAPLVQFDLQHSCLTALDGIGDHSSLKVILLSGCRQLADVSALRGAPNLRLASLHNTAVTPEQVPESVRWAGTWLRNPHIHELASRPLPPNGER